EGEDPRIIQAARLFATRRCGVPVLLGDRAEIKRRASQLDIRLNDIRIMEPERSDDLDLFLPMVDALTGQESLTDAEKREMVLHRNHFAALMLATGRVDALVSGATMSSASGLRSLFRIIPKARGVKTASSLMILDQEDPRPGIQPTIFLADCGVI